MVISRNGVGELSFIPRLVWLETMVAVTVKPDETQVELAEEWRRYNTRAYEPMPPTRTGLD